MLELNGETAMLGLDFSFRFRKVVKVGELITMSWDIVAVQPKTSLQGVLVDLDGQIVNEQGQVALTGKGKTLVTEKL